jgi:hypothetical protein
MPKHIDNDGVIRFFNKKGEIHNQKGPAIIYPNGDKFYLIRNFLHRKNGPAIEWATGEKEYYWLDKPIEEKEFRQLTTKLGKILYA